MAKLMGIDNGTTSAKGVEINDSGEVLKVVTTPTEGEIARYGRGSVSEQEPDDWIAPAYDNANQLVGAAGTPDALGISAQMHGLVLVGKDGKPIRRSIIWNDTSTSVQSYSITKRTGKDVGHMTIAKLLKVKQEEPDVYARIHKAMLPEDYIRFRFTGEMTTTPQGLSEMRLWDFKNGCLDTAVLEELDIPPDIFPEIRGDLDLHGRVTREAANATKIKEGTPVYGSAGDQQAAAIGNGVVGVGIAGGNSGTSGIIALVTRDNNDKSGNGIYWMRHLDGTNLVLACTLSCGESYQWGRDVVADYLKPVAERLGIPTYGLMNQLAAKAEPGSGGVVWMPYLGGERSPINDANVRAAYIGINRQTTTNELLRAILEGVAHSFRHCQDVLAKGGNTFSRMRASKTGLLTSDLFAEILAADLGVPIDFVNTPGGPYGIALAAGVGAGVYKSLEEACARTIRVESTVEPNAGLRAKLEPGYHEYREFQPMLSQVHGRRE